MYASWKFRVGAGDRSCVPWPAQRHELKIKVSVSVCSRSGFACPCPWPCPYPTPASPCPCPLRLLCPTTTSRHCHTHAHIGRAIALPRGSVRGTALPMPISALHLLFHSLPVPMPVSALPLSCHCPPALPCHCHTHAHIGPATNLPLPLLHMPISALPLPFHCPSTATCPCPYQPCHRPATATSAHGRALALPCPPPLPCCWHQVSVGHRLQLVQYHTHVLEHGGGTAGTWTLYTSHEYLSRAGRLPN